MAFAYKPKNSKTWRIGYYDKVSRHLKTVSTGTRIEAEARKKAKDRSAKERLHIQDSNLIPLNQSRMKLSEAFKMFLTNKNYKAKTAESFKIPFAHLIQAIGDKHLYRLSYIDGLMITNYFNDHIHKLKGKNDLKEIITLKEKKLSINSKASYTKQLSTFFNWLVKLKFVNNNIIERVKYQQKEVEIIPPHHLQLIFNKLKETNQRNYDLIRLKYLGAFRKGEITESCVEDYDFRMKILHIRNSKGSRTDSIPMIEDLEAHLLTMDKPEAGKTFNVSYEALKSLWRRLMDSLGLDYAIHQLRKTRGTELAEIGVDSYFLQQFMRHKRYSTTEQYYLRKNIDKARESINQKLKLSKIDLR
ncbi:MAG: tyrosine-type recombinase/integrase [Candidatus Kapaibacterium sp.]